MVQVPESTADLAAVLEQPVDLNFELPDPEDEEILEYDFQIMLGWYAIASTCKPKSGGDEFCGLCEIERKKAATDGGQDF